MPSKLELKMREPASIEMEEDTKGTLRTWLRVTLKTTLFTAYIEEILAEPTLRIVQRYEMFTNASRITVHNSTHSPRRLWLQIRGLIVVSSWQEDVGTTAVKAKKKHSSLEAVMIQCKATLTNVNSPWELSKQISTRVNNDAAT